MTDSGKQNGTGNSEWIEIYKIEHERLAEHESQRFKFSSLVTAISVGTLVFISRSELNLFKVSLLLSLLIVINYLAIEFIKKARMWVKFHQNRIKKILDLGPKDIGQAIRSVPKINSDKDWFRRERLHKYLHWGVIIVIVLFLFVELWPSVKPWVSDFLILADLIEIFSEQSTL